MANHPYCEWNPARRRPATVHSGCGNAFTWYLTDEDGNDWQLCDECVNLAEFSTYLQRYRLSQWHV